MLGTRSYRTFHFAYAITFLTLFDGGDSPTSPRPTCGPVSYTHLDVYKRQSLALMRALWTQAETTFEGRYYSVHGARCDPRPASLPRIIVGGGSKGILTVAARFADVVGVNTSRCV